MKRILLIYVASTVIAGFLVNPSLPQSSPSHRGDWITYLVYPWVFALKIVLGDIHTDGGVYLAFFALVFVSLLVISMKRVKR